MSNQGLGLRAGSALRLHAALPVALLLLHQHVVPVVLCAGSDPSPDLTDNERCRLLLFLILNSLRPDLAHYTRPLVLYHSGVITVIFTAQFLHPTTVPPVLNVRILGGALRLSGARPPVLDVGVAGRPLRHVHHIILHLHLVVLCIFYHYFSPIFFQHNLIAMSLLMRFTFNHYLIIFNLLQHVNFPKVFHLLSPSALHHGVEVGPEVVLPQLLHHLHLLLPARVGDHVPAGLWPQLRQVERHHVLHGVHQDGGSAGCCDPLRANIAHNKSSLVFNRWIARCNLLDSIKVVIGIFFHQLTSFILLHISIVTFIFVAGHVVNNFRPPLAAGRTRLVGAKFPAFDYFSSKISLLIFIFGSFVIITENQLLDFIFN